MSALSTRLTRGPCAATASTAPLTTARHSSQSPSIVVNIESVRCGRPEARTTATASATAAPTEPSGSEVDGETEKATSMPPPYSAWSPPRRPPGRRPSRGAHRAGFWPEVWDFGAPGAGGAGSVADVALVGQHGLDAAEAELDVDADHVRVLLGVARLDPPGLRREPRQLL